MRVYERPAQILRPDIDPARRVLVVSDIHANIPYFDGVLSRAGFCDDDILIIDGDFLEKSTQSLEMLHRVMELSSRENVYTVMGNCDEWSAIFIETQSRWADSIMKYVNWRKSGLLWDMIHELGDNPAQIQDFQEYKFKLGKAFPDEFAFLDSLPHAIESGNYIFAHAAVYPGKPLEAHTEGKLLRCDRFMDLGFSFDKWVVVGHYPVVLYGEDKVCAIPIIDRQRHIAQLPYHLRDKRRRYFIYIL